MNLSNLSPNEFLDKLNNLFKLYTESNSTSFNDMFIESYDDSTENKIKYLTATEFLERVQNIVNMYMSESMDPLKKMTFEQFKKAINEDKDFPKTIHFYKSFFEYHLDEQDYNFKMDYKLKVLISIFSKFPERSTDEKIPRPPSPRWKHEFLESMELYIEEHRFDEKYLGGLFSFMKLLVTKSIRMWPQYYLNVLGANNSRSLTYYVASLHHEVKSKY